MPAPRGVFALLVSLLLATATIAATMPPGLPTATTSWPPSDGLVLAEVMTGGASASDEYVEIANSGTAAVDLGSCELVYVTASGSTVTRKALFSAPLPLAPGQHLLVANATGIYGPLADATYSSGLASDGGAVALRHLDGTVIDAVGWGTATNSFVEGSVAPAPPAKSSLERLPGGLAGNTRDTNDNLSDWFIQPNPVPQSLASSPAPGPTASPSPVGVPTATASANPPATEPGTEQPTPTFASSPAPDGTPESTATASPESTDGPTPAPTSIPEPTSTQTETPSGTPTGTPAATPTATTTPPPTPSPTATSTATAKPTATPTPTPTATAKPTMASTPTATATPTTTPTATRAATPSPTATALASPVASSSASGQPSGPISIAAARSHQIGARVHVTGVVTVGAGLVGADDLCAIEDATGGIFVRLPAATVEMAIGQSVDVEGALAAPYGQLEIRGVDLLVVGTVGLEPEAAHVDLADIGEKNEGSLVTISGSDTSVTTDSGRLTITIGDGISSIRVLADPPTGLSRDDVTRGDTVSATGIVGQRATATGRLDGYRLWLRRGTDLVVQEPPDSATGSPSAVPSPLSTASAAHRDLASALGTRGAAVDVVATVIGAAWALRDRWADGRRRRWHGSGGGGPAGFNGRTSRGNVRPRRRQGRQMGGRPDGPGLAADVAGRDAGSQPALDHGLVEWLPRMASDQRMRSHRQGGPRRLPLAGRHDHRRPRGRRPG
ncbi:MAG: lamin tail domain-containing protein [Candidatus Limnocylindrales bacterium]